MMTVFAADDIFLVGALFMVLEVEDFAGYVSYEFHRRVYIIFNNIV
jgi:hypothetical protein